jgi:hypothetical protein
MRQNTVPNSPYFLALNSGFFERAKAINNLPGKHTVKFAHDDDILFSQYLRLYHEFRKKNPKTASQMGGFIPLDDERHPPLQGAELTANVTRNFAKQWLDDRSEASLQRLKGKMYMIGILEKTTFSTFYASKNKARLVSSQVASWRA